MTQEKTNIISGFSKLSRDEKINSLKHQFHQTDTFTETLNAYLRADNQSLFDGFSENTLSNFILPFGVAPNFLIDNKWVAVPMVTEESSVIAAAAKAARFWASHGGFKTTIKETIKTGQIHFEWHGTKEILDIHLSSIATELKNEAAALSQAMEKRGGGILNFKIMPTGDPSRALWQLLVEFETADSMGANYINSCLEVMGVQLQTILNTHSELKNSAHPATVIMCILSNYTPNCVVECSVECPVDDLSSISGVFTPIDFARRFEQAIYIATHDQYRAATHNKGILNGIDAVVIATGNDFRAVEANAHVYASKNGSYQSLTSILLSETTFRYSLQIPLALGTVGGLTKLHPMAKVALELLGQPSAKELMAITAAAGLANNFMAVSSLVTHGIQQGHMKLHLTNILNQLEATDEETKAIRNYFQHKTVSHNEVKIALSQLRNPLI